MSSLKHIEIKRGLTFNVESDKDVNLISAMRPNSSIGYCIMKRQINVIFKTYDERLANNNNNNRPNY